MTDRRMLAANGRVALAALKGQVAADRFVAGEMRQIAVPVAPIWCDRDGQARQRELLYGAQFTVLEEDGVRAFGQSARDGYVGYVAVADLAAPTRATHVVSALATHLYSAPDLKSPNIMGLGFGSRLGLVGQVGRFMETVGGAFVPEQHVRALDSPAPDIVSVARKFLGVPYLWGGNSSWGIDCSGLVQAAMLACGHDCPGDADMQQVQVGDALSEGAPTQPGDLIFWSGHVAIVVDRETLIHANANDMAVAYEPMDSAIARIADQGEGPVTVRRRI